MHGGLTYNPANGLLYAVTGSTCDLSPWYGRIVAINTSVPSIAGSFFTMSGTASPRCQRRRNMGTGRCISSTRPPTMCLSRPGMRIRSKGTEAKRGIRRAGRSSCQPTLNTIVASNYPTKYSGNFRGKTILTLARRRCFSKLTAVRPMLAAVNKSGMFELYDVSSISYWTDSNLLPCPSPQTGGTSSASRLSIP